MRNCLKYCYLRVLESFVVVVLFDWRTLVGCSTVAFIEDRLKFEIQKKDSFFEAVAEDLVQNTVGIIGHAYSDVVAVGDFVGVDCGS
jgi:hypothetical protein